MGRISTVYGSSIVFALALAAPLLATSGAAHAADAQGRFAAKGAARTRCEHFVKARDERNENPNLHYIFGGWLEGYLSAVNQYSEDTYDITAFHSTDLLLALLYGNCKDKPDALFFNVVRAMVEALHPSRIAAYSELIEVKGSFQTREGEEREYRMAVYQETLRRMQAELKRRGYYDGGVDGQYGPKTRSAIEQFQREQSLPETGAPDQVTLLRLLGEEHS